MPWGNRQDPSDSGQRNEYGEKPCPRCGELITTCAFGRKSHLNACYRRKIKYRGKTYSPSPELAGERFSGVKTSLKNRLKTNGYKSEDERLWEKHSSRTEISVTLHDTKFEVFSCEHPAREGWSHRFYRYTYENVENFQIYVRT